MVRMTERFGAAKVWMVAAVAVAWVIWCAPARAASWWQPPQQLTWYWQLQGTVKTEPVMATDMDGFDTTAATVAQFHALGQRAICYIDVGTAEDFRSDFASIPKADEGATNGWPGETWLNIADLKGLEPVMHARFQMCASKGFDAVEADNVDGYENDTGFPLTAANQLAYNEWYAQDIHSLGMAVFQKNDPDQSAALQPYFDGAIDEQCNEYSECSSYAPYVSAGKPVLDAEYQSSLYPGFCSADAAAHIMGALYALALDGSTYQPCFGPSTTSGGGSSSGPGTPAPSAPAKGPSAKPRPRPRVAIGRGPLKAVNGLVRVALRCPAGETFCAGELRVQALLGTNRRRVSALLGTARFHMRAGRMGMVTVKLRTAGRKRLGKRRRVSVHLSVLARDRAGRTARSERVDELRIARAR